MFWRIWLKLVCESLGQQMQREYVLHRQLDILRDTSMSLPVHKEALNNLFLEFIARPQPCSLFTFSFSLFVQLHRSKEQKSVLKKEEEMLSSKGDGSSLSSSAELEPQSTALHFLGRSWCSRGVWAPPTFHSARGDAAPSPACAPLLGCITKLAWWTPRRQQTLFLLWTGKIPILWVKGKDSHVFLVVKWCNCVCQICSLFTK